MNVLNAIVAVLQWLVDHGPAIVAAVAAILAWIKTLEGNKSIDETHDLVNSRLTDLIAATRAASHAAGVVEGIRQATAARAEPGAPKS